MEYLVISVVIFVDFTNVLYGLFVVLIVSSLLFVIGKLFYYFSHCSIKLRGVRILIDP